MAKRILNIRAGIKPDNSTPLTILEARNIIIVFIIKVNKPKLNMLIGRVKIINNGLMVIFKKPRARARIRAAQMPEIET